MNNSAVTPPAAMPIIAIILKLPLSFCISVKFMFTTLVDGIFSDTVTSVLTEDGVIMVILLFGCAAVLKWLEATNNDNTKTAHFMLPIQKYTYKACDTYSYKICQNPCTICSYHIATLTVGGPCIHRTEPGNIMINWVMIVITVPLIHELLLGAMVSLTWPHRFHQ